MTRLSGSTRRRDGHRVPLSRALDQLLDLAGDVLGVRAQAVDLALQRALGTAGVPLESPALAGQRTLAPRQSLGAPALEAIELAPHAAQVRVGLGGLANLVAHRGRRPDLDQHRALDPVPQGTEPGGGRVNLTAGGPGGLAADPARLARGPAGRRGRATGRGLGGRRAALCGISFTRGSRALSGGLTLG